MKLSLLVVAALALSALLHRRSAALRHWVLTSAIVCAAFLPVLELAVPAWKVPFGAPAPFERYTAGDDSRQSSESGGASRTSTTLPAEGNRASSASLRSFSLPDSHSLLRLIWMSGATLSLLTLACGLGRLRWLASRSVPVTRGRWFELAQEISRDLALAHPVAILQSHHPSLLVTWGMLRPKVVLPASAAGWPESRMRVVLTHELGHIRRGDWLAQLAAETVRCINWFNPLFWIACRRIRLESEQACDDEVLRQGLQGPEYATHLVELARLLKQKNHSWLPAPAMARPCSLERRVRAMLNNDLNRRPLTTGTRGLVTAAMLVCAGIIAAAQSSFMTVAGTVVDPQSQGIPGVTLELTSTSREAKYQVKTDQVGAYEFIGIPAGSYVLEVRGLGFQALTEPLSLSGSRLQRDFALQIGSLQETITVALRPGDAPGAPKLPKEVPMPAPPACTPVAEGGRIIPPKKIRDLAPVYPASGAQGVVTMEATIGVDGFLRDIRVTNVADPDLAAAAVVAVREWRFTQTMLNCAPVDVMMKITTRFEHRQ